MFLNKKNVILFGGTGQSKKLRPLLEEQGYNIVAIFDKNINIQPPFDDIPLYPENQYDKFIQQYYKKHKINPLYFVPTMCNPHGRIRIAMHNKFIKHYKLKYINLIDKTSRIAKNAFIGTGVQILANACVMEEVKMGQQCIIDTGAIVEHECVLGSGTELSPGAIMCGLVKTGINVWIGAGATILPRLTIGDDVIVGANSTVTKDIPSGVVVVGSPAKFLRNI